MSICPPQLTFWPMFPGTEQLRSGDLERRSGVRDAGVGTGGTRSTSEGFDVSTVDRSSCRGLEFPGFGEDSYLRCSGCSRRVATGHPRPRRQGGSARAILSSHGAPHGALWVRRHPASSFRPAPRRSACAFADDLFAEPQCIHGAGGGARRGGGGAAAGARSWSWGRLTGTTIAPAWWSNSREQGDRYLLTVNISC
jgi:hypothetical protein